MIYVLWRILQICTSLNQSEDSTFTLEQKVLFKKRYEEGYMMILSMYLG